MKAATSFTSISAAIGLSLGLVGPASAQDYPVRPITLIVPQAAGGGNDVIARILADNMGRRLGQQIIVENRAGAGGTLGTRALAKSEPDGYTLAMGSTGTVAMAPTAYANAGYDPHKDFAPIGLIARSAIVLVTGPSIPAKSVQELVDLGKKDPGKLTCGANPAINDVMAGHVSMIFSSLPPTLGNIKGGRLKALGMATLKRSTTLPDVPTIDESGIRGFEAEQRYGLLAPAGTPATIVARLNAVLREALTSPDVIARIAADGAEPQPSTPEEYTRDIEREEAKWSKVVREAGAKAE